MQAAFNLRLYSKVRLRAQTALRGVVALRYQQVGNEVPQLRATLWEPLDLLQNM